MNGKHLLVCVLIVVLQCADGWKTDRRPRIYGDKIPFEALLPTRKKIQHKIVLFHNHFRAKVAPRASNMLRMKWHKGAAVAAQRWSEDCMFLIHDNVTGRFIDEYGACGQNIFVSSHRVPWMFAVKTWFLEKDLFTYGNDEVNDLKQVGHYTQMVWAATHEVGCGISRCFSNQFTNGIFYNYVCNYCPIGNRPTMLGHPYKGGESCGECQQHCHRKRLCTNACPYADLWINCADLYRYWPAWLCNSSSPKGEERALSCRATCNCKGRIYD